jgi:hypothetical protein
MGGLDFRLPLKLCNLSFLDAMERAHAGVVLYPDANDSKLRVDPATINSAAWRQSMHAKWRPR